MPAKKVQAPKTREVSDFDSLEVFAMNVSVIVIARDDRGKKLGTFSLDNQQFFETDDLIEWAGDLENKLEDADTKEDLRQGITEQRSRQMEEAASRR